MQRVAAVTPSLVGSEQGADTTPAELLTPQSLCDRYAPRVYRFAAMVSSGEVEAEDLAQDALERAIRRISTFDPARGAVESRLWQIVISAASDAGRVSKRRRLLLERLTTFRVLPADNEVEIADDVTNDGLLAAVRGLGARDRALIALHYGAGLDYAAVGAALAVSPAAAGVAGRRALARLRKTLRGDSKGTQR